MLDNPLQDSMLTYSPYIAPPGGFSLKSTHTLDPKMHKKCGAVRISDKREWSDRQKNTRTHASTHARMHTRTHAHAHTNLTALFPGLPEPERSNQSGFY